MGFGAAQGAGLNPLKQVELSSDPAAIANTGQAYWKDTGSGDEFYLEDESGNVIQVTSGSGMYNIFPDSLYVTGGSLGLGTQTPSSTFEIEGSSGDLTLEIDNNVTNSANLKIQCPAGSPRADLTLDDSLHITMRGQRVGILQTNPAYTLDVTGNAQVTTDMTVGGSVGLGVTDPDEQLEITGRLHMGQIAAPGTTTDKLYNVAGALTWNGTDISAGGGGGISTVVTKTANYTAVAGTDDVILCNTTGAFTITLPAISGNTGQVFYIKSINTGTITVDADGTETIDGDLNKFITTKYETLTLCCTGATPDWAIL